MKSKRLRYAIVAAGCLALGAPLLAQVAAPTAAPAPAATQPAVDPNKVVITVGDEKITAQEFNDFIGDLPAEIQNAARGPAKRMIADRLVQLKLLATEARKRGLDQTPQFKRQSETLQLQILANLLFDQMQKNDDAELKQYYDEHKSEMEEITTRHILIRAQGAPMPAADGKKELTDAEAKAKAEEIRARLEKGEDFAAIAKAESDDKGSGANGGALPPFHHGEFEPAFERAAASLKAGETSQPVKTAYGYHVIQVQDKKTPTFEEAKAQIQDKVAPEKVKNLLDDLKKSTKTSLDESFFGPAAPAGGAMPMPME